MSEQPVPRPRPRANALSRRAARSNRRAIRQSIALAVLLCLAYLLAGRMGGDLSAQLARADFAADHPFVAVDFRWFGGVQPWGYSLWTPPLMALLGVRVTGVLATLTSVALFAILLRRVRAPRQRLAAATAAVTFAASLAEGRVTFACGLAAGLGALVRLAGRDTRVRPFAATALAGLAAAASPVAGVYLLLCATALVVRGRLAPAAPLLGAVVPLAITSAVFGDGGRQVFSANDAIRAAAATIVVLVLVPRRSDVLRAGLVLALAMVLLAALLPTPLGSNSARLSLLFAIPVAAAYARLRAGLGVLSVLVVAVIQPPVVLGTLVGAGKPVTEAAYFQPLIEQLRSGKPLTGRVEVPELTGHWDAAYLARAEPLSRGWLRQLDTDLNDDVFYRHLPTAQTYRQFLDRTATQYVAVADARATFYGRRELRLIATGLPYLRPVWRDRHWTLYAVSDATPVVAAPATLASYRPDRITLDAPADADVTVRIRWVRWLTVAHADGACLRRAGDAVVLHTTTGGRYVITSSVVHRSPRCPTD